MLFISQEHNERQSDWKKKSLLWKLISARPGPQRQPMRFRLSLMSYLATCMIFVSFFKLSYLNNRLKKFRRTNDREKQILTTERDRQSNAQRTYENDLHQMQLRETRLTSQIRDKDMLEANIGMVKKEITSCTARLKVVKWFPDQSKSTILMACLRNWTKKLMKLKLQSNDWTKNTSRAKPTSMPRSRTLNARHKN